jgi:hypothetical protein
MGSVPGRKAVADAAVPDWGIIAENAKKEYRGFLPVAARFD